MLLIIKVISSGFHSDLLNNVGGNSGIAKMGPVGPVSGVVGSIIGNTSLNLGSVFPGTDVVLPPGLYNYSASPLRCGWFEFGPEP